MARQKKEKKLPTQAEMQILLGLSASGGALYGAQIVQRGYAVAGGVYTLLQRLTESGYVAATVPKHVAPHKGKPRPVYSLTPAAHVLIAAYKSL